MSTARDDYPYLAELASMGSIPFDVLNEIDLLRSDVASLLAKLAQAELKLRIAADPNASLWNTFGTNPEGTQ